MDHYSYLQYIHRTLNPSTYFEIGVETGRSLSFANCPAVGVDPSPRLQFDLPTHTTVYSLPSDDYFKAHDPSDNLKAPIDFSFIDGMHLFEYSLRDFINVERSSHEATVVVIHDVLPQTVRQASRSPQDDGWAGDIFLMSLCLRKYRPDLFIAVLDVPPTGVLLVSNLNPKSSVLTENYDQIVQEHLAIDYATIHAQRNQVFRVMEADSRVTNLVVERAKFKRSLKASEAILAELHVDPRVNFGGMLTLR